MSLWHPKKIAEAALITQYFTAGEAITEGQVVYVSGANTVSVADSTKRRQVIGVAAESAAVGEAVKVILYGIATVTADGAISVGDPVAAAPTAGRVVSLTDPSTTSVAAHTHSISSVGNHTHSISTTGSYYHMISPGTCPAGHSACVATATLLGMLVTSSTSGAAGAHNHGGATGSAGAHSHTIPAAQIVGKALEAATAAGDKIKILVCLS